MTLYKVAESLNGKVYSNHKKIEGAILRMRVLRQLGHTAFVYQYKNNKWNRITGV